jgi:hypothetical protein
MTTIRLRPADLRAIAEDVVELLLIRPPANPDPWLTRVAAAAYLGMSARSFARQCKQYPRDLPPVSMHPLRWAKSQLDRYKFHRQSEVLRPTRKRRQEGAAA